MTDTKQPEALRLANSLQAVRRYKAAAELRRQHAEIEALQDDLAHKDDYAEQLGRELAKADSEAKKLRAKLDELEKQRPCGYLPYGYVGRSAMVFGQPVPESVPIYLAAGARPVEPAPDAVVGLPFAIMDNELKALRRFDECVRDPDAGGHDVRKEMMKRLAEIGLVRRVTANIYEHTNFGLSVLNGDFDAAPTTQPAPAAQDDAKDAARWRYAVEIGGNQRMNWLDVYNDWDGEGSFVDAIDAALEASKKGADMSTRTWHKGPPPFPGWWNASTCRDKKIWRWWDGQYWSFPVYSSQAAEEAAVMATPTNCPERELIEWTDYWPENARVPRVYPRSKL